MSGVPLDTGAKVGPGQFLPRLGTAWRLGDRTVVRAGYGLSSDPKPFIDFRNSYPISFAWSIPSATFNGANNAFLPVTTLRTQRYWERVNGVRFPAGFEPTLGWSHTFGRRVMTEVGARGHHLYLMPITVDVTAYLDGFALECAKHGAQFDVRTGKVLAPPALIPVKTFQVQVVGDEVQVAQR